MNKQNIINSFYAVNVSFKANKEKLRELVQYVSPYYHTDLKNLAINIYFTITVSSFCFSFEKQLMESAEFYLIKCNEFPEAAHTDYTNVMSIRSI